MAWFGRKDRDEAESSKTAPPDTAGLDFGKYQLDSFGADVRSIIDVPGAVAQTAKWAFTLPFLVAIVVWVAFSSRMATWVLIPFSIVTFMLAGMTAVVIGGFFVARKRLDLVADASSRVIDVIGEMHADVMRIKDGHAGTSVQGVAVGLLEHAIFPAVFGTLTTTAETTMGPLGRFSARIAKGPMGMVEKSVISAIRSLPDREIGQLVDDVTDALPEATASMQRLASEYTTIRGKIEGIVNSVSRTALSSMLGLAVAASIPLVIWLGLGWLLS